MRAGVRGPELEVGRHELVLAAEVLIERRLRRVGLRQDAVNPYRPYALLIEQAIGGVEKAVPDADCGGCSSFPRFLRHLLTIQTDRSIVNGMNKKNALFSASHKWMPRSVSRVARPSGVSIWVPHSQARPHSSPAPTVASAKPSLTRSSRPAGTRCTAAPARSRHSTLSQTR